MNVDQKKIYTKKAAFGPVEVEVEVIAVGSLSKERLRYRLTWLKATSPATFW